MVVGDVKNISLSSSSFERMITEGRLYVDKTRMIENFLNHGSEVHLVARQRRLGKSLNMDMLRCFLTDRTDFRHLFKGLYIESSSVWGKANSAPVFYFDFKTLSVNDYKLEVVSQVYKHIKTVIEPDNLNDYLKWKFDNLMKNPDGAEKGLLLLTEIVYEVTGKRSYLLIDEYDKLLLDNYGTGKYKEIKAFETALLSAALKGNQYLEKALLTGVMRISHESMLSGLNNIVAFDVFNDELYLYDYGLTDNEMKSLSKLADINIDDARKWYNGIKIGGYAIYNIYSVMSYLARGKLECYWGNSGTMCMIADLLNDNRKASLAKLLNGERVEVGISNRISMSHLSNKTGDQAFFSFLVQSGYLALDEDLTNDATTAVVSIPNTELMVVWKRFILEALYANTPRIKTMFDNADNLTQFAKDLEYLLSDSLSYHDLASRKKEDTGKAQEQIYHVFVLGMLSAYDDVHCRRPRSNRESGDGRYDIWVEKPTANFIFEFKSVTNQKNLDSKAKEALSQIESKRYGMDISNMKRLVRVGVAICGKMCKVICDEEGIS